MKKGQRIDMLEAQLRALRARVRYLEGEAGIVQKEAEKSVTGFDIEAMNLLTELEDERAASMGERFVQAVKETVERRGSPPIVIFDRTEDGAEKWDPEPYVSRDAVLVTSDAVIATGGTGASPNPPQNVSGPPVYTYTMYENYGSIERSNAVRIMPESPPCPCPQCERAREKTEQRDTV